MNDPNLWFSLLHPDDIANPEVALPIRAAPRRALVRRYRMRPKGSLHYRWIEDVALLRYDGMGAVVGQEGLARDVTVATWDEERLATLARAVAETADHVLVTDAVGRVLWVNPAFERFTGYALPEIRGQTPRFLKSGLHDASFYRAFWTTIAAGDTWRGVFINQKSDGSVFYEEKTVSPVKDDSGRITQYVSTGRDITANIEMVGALRESEERYRELFENANDMVFTTDLQGNFTSVNQAAQRVTGYSPEQLLQMRFHDVVAPEFLPLLQRLTEPGVEERVHRAAYELELVTPDGDRVRVEVNPRLMLREGTAVAIQGIARDVGDRWRSEQAMLRAQKAESLGVLAGGIAHDFNNLLVGILGNASLALAEADNNAGLRELLTDIERAGIRAADLARQMLAYAGKGSLLRAPFDVGSLAAEMAELLRASVSRRVSLMAESPGPGLVVDGDVTQLRQVLMNLVINAADAIGDSEGLVRVRAGSRTVDRQELASAYATDEAGEGAYVFIEVSDNGCGMTPEVQQRIFDPFFTTKFTGRGLGLAATLGIVRSHGGAISVDSRPGEGTTFTILLPLAGEGAATASVATSSNAPRPAAQAAQPRGVALVIDDDHAVRRVVSRMLERGGMEVLGAATGEEGIQHLCDRGRDISLVLLDLTMPGLSGEATLARIRSAVPTAPVIVMSGHSEEDIQRRLGGLSIDGLVTKPFDVAALQEEVDRVLARA